MIDWQRVQWGSFAQWLSAGATLFAVFVALFKDQIIARWRHPKLTVRALMSPPDSDKIPIWFPIGSPLPGQRQTGRFGDCYFLRLWIKNDGDVRAEQVQVFANKLSRRSANGTFTTVESFLPMNLRWGYGREAPTRAEIFNDGISPEMGMHCNLGHVTDPECRQWLNEHLPEVGQDQTILHLETELKANNRCYLLAPGIYHLELLIAGSNCRPVSYTLELMLTGKWFEDRDKMFQDGVMMKLATNIQQ